MKNCLIIFEHKLWLICIESLQKDIFQNFTIENRINVCDWIDLFEAELSVAQTTGFAIILIGDFNINYLKLLK